MDSISKVGSAVAPYVVDLGGEVNPGKNIISKFLYFVKNSIQHLWHTRDFSWESFEIGTEIIFNTKDIINIDKESANEQQAKSIGAHQ